MRSVRLFMFAACAVLVSAYLLLSEVRYADVPDSPLFQASLAATKAELVSLPESQFQTRSERGSQRRTCEVTCDASCHVATCGTTCLPTCRNTCTRTCSQPSCMVSCGPATCDVTCRNTCQYTCSITCSQPTCELTCLVTCSYTCTMQLHAGAFNPRPAEESSESGPEEAEQQ